MSWLVYDIKSIHKIMVRVYGCVNGHQLVPLIPSGLVKNIGKGLGIHFMCIMVLVLWCTVASARLENGYDPINSQVS